MDGLHLYILFRAIVAASFMWIAVVSCRTYTSHCGASGCYIGHFGSGGYSIVEARISALFGSLSASLRDSPDDANMV